ncbi:DUF7281 domain-containing protein [Colwellia sp. 20A7]|uniref:DUF7281 domain-containing protein n=1 Tax=Colwellia sp. 20A7 TaxID=2689569 RepID=UPI001357EF3E|nr:hypothetical protein [Colwellia sp. 20A7]
MNKSLYNFTQDKLQKHRQGGRIKNTALATKLYSEHNFGHLDLSKSHLSFSLDDILALSKRIQKILNVDIRHDAYPEQQSRNINASNNRNEKINSLPVSKDFILINSLSDIKVNQTSLQLSPLTSLGIYVKADDILSIEHKAIVFVENLAVMASLSTLNLTSIHEELVDALWVYRGDIKKQQSTSTAYQFFRRFNHHQRICFSDVDPKGIEIALTSQADYWLTIKNIEDFKQVVERLEGSEEEWFKQGASIQFLQNKYIKAHSQLQHKPTWQPIFSVTSSLQKTLKQEHIITHNMALTLLEL